ncbi:hypothetical protein P280DRAFT_484104 [Massarina eburnea CBS 473.64]|uniref:Uncharacterized protein n=1 Tax=Massarina eburnea CBS 473.64 TaxID=1395130 RepID=A0A6A6RKU1_9PLEO|nr:hypothetical protein P280DRAFT_484104 [Massarina eburnea CBS 473.64]
MSRPSIQPSISSSGTRPTPPQALARPSVSTTPSRASPLSSNRQAVATTANTLSTPQVSSRSGRQTSTQSGQRGTPRNSKSPPDAPKLKRRKRFSKGYKCLDKMLLQGFLEVALNYKTKRTKTCLNVRPVTLVRSLFVKRNVSFSCYNFLS